MSPEPPDESNKTPSGGTLPNSQESRILHVDHDSAPEDEDASKVVPSEIPSGQDERVIPGRSTRHRQLRLAVLGQVISFVSRLPFVILASLLAAGLLTIEWDGYQKEAELRAKLVSDINISVARANVSAHFIAAGVYGIEKQGGGVNVVRVKHEYNKRKWTWEQDAARIAGQLEAYFTDPSVGDQWQAYSDIIGGYFELSYPMPEKKDVEARRGDLRSRHELVRRIADYLNDNAGGKPVMGGRLKRSLEGRSDGHLGEYYGNYRKLGRKLLPAQKSLSKRILFDRTEIGPPIGLVRRVKAKLS